MDPANIEQFVKNNTLNVTTSHQTDQWILDGMAASQTRQTIKFSDAARIRGNTWSMIMKRNYMKVASVAAILCLAGIGIYLSGGAIDGAQPAFADMFSSVQQARTVVYAKDFYKDNGENLSFTTKESVMEGGHKRIDMPSGDISIFDNANGVHVQVLPGVQMAIITKSRPSNRSSVFDFMDWLKSLNKNSAEYQGKVTVDGQNLNLFIAKQDYSETSIWIDPATNLPVKVQTVIYQTPNACVLELNSVAFGDSPEDGITRSQMMGSKEEKRVTVMRDFQWNVNLGSELFSTAVPEGYKSTINEPKLKPNKIRTESTILADALGFWLEHDGKLPANMQDLVNQKLVEKLLVKAFDGDDDPKEELNAAMGQVRSFMHAANVFNELSTVTDVHYSPVETPGANTPILWWTMPNKTEVEVIYGDMTVKRVLAEEFNN